MAQGPAPRLCIAADPLYDVATPLVFSPRKKHRAAISATKSKSVSLVLPIHDDRHPAITPTVEPGGGGAPQTAILRRLILFQCAQISAISAISANQQITRYISRIAPIRKFKEIQNKVRRNLLNHINILLSNCGYVCGQNHHSNHPQFEPQN